MAITKEGLVFALDRAYMLNLWMHYEEADAMMRRIIYHAIDSEGAPYGCKQETAGADAEAAEEATSAEGGGYER